MPKDLMEKDLAAAEGLYKRIRENKDLILSFIDDILDLVTFLPVCIAEYSNNEFELLNPHQLIVEDILCLLNEYGFQIHPLKGF